MKTTNIPQIAIVEAPNAQELQQEVNRILSEHPDVDDISLQSDCHAIIKYTISKEEPESLEDRYRLEHGKTYHCNDCPYLEWDPDMRSVTHYCKHHSDRTRKTTPACEEFYSMLMVDQIHPVTADEREAAYKKMRAEEDERRKRNRNYNMYISHSAKEAAEYLREIDSILNGTDLNTRDFYMFETTKTETALSNKILLPEEISLFENGYRKKLSERSIIAIGKRYGAMEIVRCRDPQYDDSCVIWNESEIIYPTKEV